MATMQFCVLLVTLGVVVVTQASDDVSRAKGLKFIGVGYNLLKGNPEGGQLSRGGVDPGLLLTRKIFKLTFNTNKTSTDGKVIVPDQVSFDHRSSCVKATTQDMFSGAKSYQDKLEVDVKASGYEQVNKETSKNHKVFYEEKTVCNIGRARYQISLASRKRFAVTEEFAASVCNLPEQYTEKTYLDFIDRWGTHIVEEVDLGTKTTERYESSYTAFTKYAMKNVGAAVSVSGGYKGFSASLSVDVSTFKESMTKGTSFGENKVVFNLGGADMPEPIGLKLFRISRAFDATFFGDLDQQYKCNNLEQRKSNILQLFTKYPGLKNATTPQDPDVRIPVTWPLGTYGLPMPKTGCPAGTFWREGTRYHDTEDSNPSNSWSSPYDLDGRAAKDNMEQKFCMKTQRQTSGYDLPWPEGKYCIFKKGSCPEGLESGSYIRWDDEDDKNRNLINGQHPDGDFGINTMIEYCCRTDGYATNPINLPTDKPFVLFKSNTRLCQEVNGMEVKDEYFYWDNEDEKPGSSITGSINAETNDELNVKLYYCYYYKKNKH